MAVPAKKFAPKSKSKSKSKAKPRLAKGSQNAITKLRELAEKECGPSVAARIETTCAALFDLKTRSAQDAIDYHWQLGRDLSEITGKIAAKAAAEQRPASDKLIRAICERLHERGDDAKASAWLYQAYPSATAFRGLLAITRANGQPIPWTMLRRIVPPNVFPFKDKLIPLLVKENWTEPDLARAIKQLKNEPAMESGQGGRQHQMPSTLGRALAKWAPMVSSYNKGLIAFFATTELTAMLERTPLEEITPVTLADARKLADQLNEIAAGSIRSAQAVLAMVTLAEERLEAALTTAGAEAEADEEEDVEAALPPPLAAASLPLQLDLDEDEEEAVIPAVDPTRARVNKAKKLAKKASPIRLHNT